MSRLHITDTPEWTRFFWVLILFFIAVIVFSCEPTHSIEIEILAEPEDAPLYKKKVNWLLSYWYYAALVVAAWAFFKAPSKMDKLPE